MNADPAELNVVRQQFARFGSKCRLYAPLYRQVTLAGLRQMMAGGGVVARPGHRLQRCPRRVALLPRARQQGPRRRADRPLAGLLRPGRADSQGDRRQAGPVAAGLGDAARRHDWPCRTGKTSAARFSTFLCAKRPRRPDASSPTRRSARRCRRRANTLFGKVADQGMVAACTNPSCARRRQRRAARLSRYGRTNHRRHCRNRSRGSCPSSRSTRRGSAFPAY